MHDNDNRNVAMTLARIASRLVGDARKRLAGPYVVDLPDAPGCAGGPWAVATDGIRVLWARDWRPALIGSPPEDGGEKIADKLRKLSGPPADWPMTFAGPVGSLQEFCEPAVWTVECPACKGLSATSEYLHCTYCDNDGVASPDVRPGFLFGVPINRNALAGLLEPFAPRTKVWVYLPQGKDAPLWFLGRTFRAGLMPMRADDPEMAEAWKNAPKFEPLAVGSGVAITAATANESEAG